MKPEGAQAAKTVAQLRFALIKAAAHLREKGNYNFLNDEPEIFTTFELAQLIEQLSDRLDDHIVVKRLWGIFAPTCAWDDAGGDSHVGQDTYDLIDALYRTTPWR